MPQGEKKKASAKKRATQRMAERRDAPQSPRVPESQRERSAGKFPGETPLSGETGRPPRQRR